MFDEAVIVLYFCIININEAPKKYQQIFAEKL